MNELMIKKQRLLEQTQIGQEQKLSMIRAKLDYQNGYFEKANEKQSEILQEIRTLESSRESIIREISQMRLTNAKDKFSAQLSSQFNQIKQMKESVIEEWWNEVQKSHEEKYYELSLFVLVVSDDEFLADKYSKQRISEEYKHPDKSEKRMDGGYIKQMLLKSYKTFMIDSSCEDKHEFISELFSLEKFPSFQVGFGNQLSEETARVFEMLCQFIVNMCQFSQVDKIYEVQLKQAQNRLDFLLRNISFQNDEQTISKLRIGQLRGEINSLKNEFSTEEKNLSHLKVQHQQVFSKLNDIRSQVLESLILKNIALDSEKSVFEEQVLGAAVYLSCFAGVSEDMRFQGLEKVSELSDEVQYYLRRLILWSIQSATFEASMYKNKELAMTNTLIHDIAWIEFILKHYSSLPYLVIKDYSGVIEEHLHKSQISQEQSYNLHSPNICKKYVRFSYFATDLLDHEASECHPVGQTFQFSDNQDQQVQNILVLVNPAKELLQKLVSKKYDDILISILKQRASQQSSEKTSFTMKAQLKIIVIYSSASFFPTNLTDIVSKCIVMNCELRSELSWRHLQKDILVNFFDFPQKMSLISDHEKKIELQLQETKTQCEEATMTMLKMDENKLQLIQNMDLSKFQEDLRSLTVKHTKDDLLITCYFTQGNRQEKSYSISSECVNTRIKREQQQSRLDDQKEELTSQNAELTSQKEELKSQNGLKEELKGQKEELKSQKEITISFEQNDNAFSQFCSGLLDVSLNKHEEYAYMIEELENVSQIYDEFTGFVYVLKETLLSLTKVFGNIYGFSDEYFRMLTVQVCDNLKHNHITPQRETICNIATIFSQFYLHTLLCALHEDHRNILTFQLGIHFLKASQRTTELHQQMLLQGSHIMRETNLITFSSQKQKNNFLILEQEMRSFYQIQQRIQIPEYTNEHTFLQQVPQQPFLKNRRTFTSPICTTQLSGLPRKPSIFQNWNNIQIPFKDQKEEGVFGQMQLVDKEYYPRMNKSKKALTRKRNSEFLNMSNPESKKYMHSNRRSLIHQYRQQLELESIPENRQTPDMIEQQMIPMGFIFLAEENSESIDSTLQQSIVSSDSLYLSEGNDQGDYRQYSGNINETRVPTLMAQSVQVNKNSDSDSGSESIGSIDVQSIHNKHTSVRASPISPFFNLKVSQSFSLAKHIRKESPKSVQAKLASQRSKMNKSSPRTAILNPYNVTRPAMKNQSLQVLQSREETTRKIRLSQEYICKHRDMFSSIDIPQICFRRVENVEKESYFYLIILQMILNQGKNRYKDVMYNIERDEKGAIMKNERGIKYLRFSDEHMKQKEKLKQLSVQKRSKQLNFFNIPEETDTLKALKTSKISVTAQTSLQRIKQKMQDAIRKSKLKRQQQLTVIKSMRSIDNIEELAEEKSSLVSHSKRLSLDFEPIIEEVQVETPPSFGMIHSTHFRKQLSRQYDFKLPASTISTLLHYQAIFANDSSSNEFTNSLKKILDNHSLLQQFLFTAVDQYPTIYKTYKIPPVLAEANLTPIEICLIIKSTKPQDLELYFTNLFSQSFDSGQGLFGTQNIDTLCRSQLLNKPILLMTSDINSNLYNILELKMIKAQKDNSLTNIGLYQIHIHSKNICKLYEQIQTLSSSGNWVVLTGIQNLHDIPTLSIAIQAIRSVYIHNQHLSHDFKLFIQYQCPSNINYNPINHSEQGSPLSYLFAICHKTFINPTSSTKNNLSHFFEKVKGRDIFYLQTIEKNIFQEILLHYMIISFGIIQLYLPFICQDDKQKQQKEVNQHLMNVEKSLVELDNIPADFEVQQKETSQNQASVLIVQPQLKRLVKMRGTEGIIHYIKIENQKRLQDKIKSSSCEKNKREHVNLHSFVRVEQSNKKMMEMIVEGEDRLKFNSYLIMSMLQQRQQFIERQSTPYGQVSYLQNYERDLQAMNNDLLDFIQLYHPSPFRFISNFYRFIFTEREEHHAQAFIDSVIRLYYQDILFYKLEAHRVIRVNGYKYPLFKIHKPNEISSKPREAQLAEQVFLNILHMPNKDPIETLGFGQNRQIEVDLKRSQEMLQVLNSHASQAKQQADKRETALSVISDILSQSKSAPHYQVEEEDDENFLFPFKDNDILMRYIEHTRVLQDDQEFLSLCNIIVILEASYPIFELVEQIELLFEMGEISMKYLGVKQATESKEFQSVSFASMLSSSVHVSPGRSSLMSVSRISKQFKPGNMPARRATIRQTKFAFSFVSSLQLGMQSIPEDEDASPNELNNILDHPHTMQHLQLGSKAESSIQCISPPKLTIAQQIGLKHLGPATFDRPCLFDRIRDYLPTKKKQSNNTQRDVLKAFSQMHKHLKQKPKHQNKIQYSKESNDYLRHILRDGEFIQIFLLNEVVTCNKVIHYIKNDIADLKEFILKPESFSQYAKNEFSHMISQIKSNQIPDKWDYYALLSCKKTLIDFLRVFLSKYEHITSVIIERNNTLFPSINLDKLFDPFGLVYSLLFQNSKKLNVPIHMLKIKLCKLKRPPVQQNYDDGLCIRGISLKYASLNPENDYLEDESTYEFGQELTYSIIKVVLRSEIKYVNVLPLIILYNFYQNQDNEAYIPVEFVDSVHSDLENRYIEQQDEFWNDFKIMERDFVIDEVNPEQQMQQQQQQQGKKDNFRHEIFGSRKSLLPSLVHRNSLSKTTISINRSPDGDICEDQEEQLVDEDTDEDNTIHFIKLPVLTYDSQTATRSSRLKLFFFFKSKQPQSFWTKRGAYICFHKDL